MSDQESWITTDDGLKIYIKRWLVPDNVDLKAKIVFNHGFSEHANAYNRVFPFFAEHGYEIIAYDQRGAGHTSPTKKTFGNTDEYHVFHDLDQIIATQTDGYKGKLFMWGHSMGGAITLNYAGKGTKRERFDGFLAFSPLVEVHPKTAPNRVLASILPFIAKWHPKYKQKASVEPSYLSDDKEYVAGVRKDPLRLLYTTAAQAHDFISRGRRLLNSHFVAKFVDRPILLIHGTADNINFYDASAKFFEILGVTDKKFTTYEGYFHEPLQMSEEKRTKVWNDTLAWLDEHSSGESHYVEPAVPEAQATEDSKKATDEAPEELETAAVAGTASDSAANDSNEAETKGTILEEPVAEEPVAEEPTAEEPTAEEPTAEEPIAEEPTAEEPSAEEPIAEEEPISEEPVTEAPAAKEEPIAEEPIAEELAAEEPVTEEPVTEEPAAKEERIAEAPAEEPAGEEPVAEEPVESKEEPTAADVQAEEPKTVETPADSAKTEAVEESDESRENSPSVNNDEATTAAKAEGQKSSGTSQSKKKKKNKKRGKK